MDIVRGCQTTSIISIRTTNLVAGGHPHHGLVAVGLVAVVVVFADHRHQFPNTRRL